MLQNPTELFYVLYKTGALSATGGEFEDTWLKDPVTRAGPKWKVPCNRFTLSISRLRTWTNLALFAKQTKVPVRPFHLDWVILRHELPVTEWVWSWCAVLDGPLQLLLQLIQPINRQHGAKSISSWNCEKAKHSWWCLFFMFYRALLWWIRSTPSRPKVDCFRCSLNKALFANLTTHFHGVRMLIKDASGYVWVL